MQHNAPPVRFADLLQRPAERAPAPGSEAWRLLLEEYRPWRKVRPIARDLGIDPEQAWAMVKQFRSPMWRTLRLYQAGGAPFGVCICPQLLERLHVIDRATGGGGPSALAPPTGDLADPSLRDRLRIRSLMDEAAESSLIEGAATTRKDAVELLRSGRDPETIGERMVVNNFLAMQAIKGWLERPLTVGMLLELQRVLTEGTLKNPDEAGRLRRADEAVRVVDARTEETIYIPPPAADLPARLESLCEFANAPTSAGPGFLHPIIKACVLHFAVGYEHPFCDGNGRTARAVFYWSALRAGYGVFEFATISELIRAGYAQYPAAYADTELDEGDITYFVLYKLDVIVRALARLDEHIRQEREKVERSRSLLKLANDLNLRQRLLLDHALRHPLTQYTVKSHMNSNGIVRNTARADLDDLVRRRLMLSPGKRGKEVLYMLAPGVEKKLDKVRPK